LLRGYWNRGYGVVLNYSVDDERAAAALAACQQISPNVALVRARHEEGEQAPANEEQPATRSSRRFTDFSYRLSLPSDVDTEAIEATMDHGLLTIRLPRSASAKPRRIEVGRKPESSSSE
jgi:hypothetical protein